MVGYCDISMELLAEICKGLRAEETWHVRVVKNRLPDDAQVVSAEIVDDGRTIRIAIESATFTEKRQQLPPPLLQTVFERGRIRR